MCSYVEQIRRNPSVIKLLWSSFSSERSDAILLEYLRLTFPGFLFLVEDDEQVAGALGAEREHGGLQDGGQDGQSQQQGPQRL